MPFRSRPFVWIAGLLAIAGLDGWLLPVFCDPGHNFGLACVDASEPPLLRTWFDQVSSPLVRTDLRLESSASCAATACHGGPRPGVASPGAIRGSEYPLWLERDPHALSWRTLCSQSSVAMMERLEIMQSGEIVDQAGFDNCLACHNSTRQFVELRSRESIREGVGCSGCHGPSEKWRSTHFLTDSSATTATAEGFVPARDMLARARMCASCHVGDRDRDMNHDIIAAGHPALHYEFATFHERQPKHWRDAGDSNVARYEAFQWLAGQIAALDAWLVLLEARAERALPVSQWPEFSAYDCSACHQSLRAGDQEWALAQKRSVGAAQFSRWNRFGVEELLRLRSAEGIGGARDFELAEALDHLTATMQSSSAPVDPSKRAAQTARLALDAWIKSPEGMAEIGQFTAQRLQALTISARRRQPSNPTWESATQFYLASVAARQSWLRTTEQLSSARQLRNNLKFKPGTYSPQPPFAQP